jgi:hypothetical protein
MGRAAELALKMRTTQTALDLLDEICGPYRNTDAEFESEDPNNLGHTHPDYVFYTDPDGPLGKLINEAFDPGRDWSGEMARAEGDEFEKLCEAWSDGPEEQFRKRYNFW